MAKRGTYQTGLYAEAAAAMMLRVKGYKILAKRYKTSFGEIDLVAAKKDWLIFVEVKARAKQRKAREAVSRKSQSRIANAAKIFLAEHPLYMNANMRFDVVTVAPGQFPRHHENMWQNETEVL